MVRKSEPEHLAFAAPPGPAIELDMPERAARGNVAVGVATGAPEPAKTTAPSDEGPPARAVELAQYGDKPSVFLEVPYALGVIARNRALRAKLPELKRLQDTAEADLAVASQALGRALYEAREHPRARELGPPLRKAHARAKQLAAYEKELDDARQSHRDQTTELREAIAIDDAHGRPLRLRAHELRTQLVVFQQDFEAASKVIADAQAELARLPEGLSDARIELEARVTQTKQKTNEALMQIEARRPELTDLEKQLAGLQARVDKTEVAITAADDALAATEARVDKESAETKQGFENAIEELADSASKRGLDTAIVPVEAKRAAIKHNAYAANAKELYAHQVALTLHYPTSVRRGLIVLALVCVGAVLEFGYLLSS